MGQVSSYPVVQIHRPEFPQVKKFVSVPYRVIYINLAAAPTANIIRVVVHPDDFVFRLPSNS